MSDNTNDPAADTLNPHDINAVVAARRAKLKNICDLGIDPWGQRFDGRSFIGEIRARQYEIKFKTSAGELIDAPEFVEGLDMRSWKQERGGGDLVGPAVRAAGRIVLHRDTGKLQFIDIQDWTGTIQLFVGKNQVGEENWKLIENLDLGDLIGVDGELKMTMRGELSIFAEKIYLLTKTIEPPPAKHVGLVDPELRQRLRYIDLAYNAESRQRFLNRTKIVQSIRRTLDENQFVEIEGPTLHSIAGGAAARPFETFHNALGMNLFLRIALELHLKRLMVGGLERVYELGRVYRNEGISPRHNPEFTMLEVYQAFGDYKSMMDLTESLIANASKAIGLGTQISWGEQQLDISIPFARRPYHELLAEHTGVDPFAERALKDYAQAIGLTVAGKHIDVIKNEIFEERVEEKLVGPVFVTDYPASICPLTKRKQDDPTIAERFELFVCGIELANAYTELNDPDLQQKLFKTQLAGLPAEESMAKMDHDFVRALRNGMPPAGGLGVGIDRLVMLLTNSQSIRDVILFPLLRAETGNPEHE
ncbi:MAG TPA: lysine--tRNA ligase [Pirellulaceae bacterium]|nr:lysine--tRNA ligase [Pirellulaceae bacterium]HMO93002.1 lysine--tRNA ligase [Pirellulaceae bacterium]HMP67920.1 lysine--tRNA ligase [Pirellulaceae bacterium]